MTDTTGAPWTARMKDAELLSTDVILPAPKRFVRESLRMPDGHEIDWYYIDTPQAVMVIPVTTSGNVVLVKQYRHNLKADTLELPAGLMSPGEDPRDAAIRELKEETGHVIDDPATLQPLGRFYCMPSETNRFSHYYLARLNDEDAGHAAGDTEIEKYFEMSVVELPFEEALAGIGRIILGMETVGALMLANRYLGGEFDER